MITIYTKENKSICYYQRKIIKLKPYEYPPPPCPIPYNRKKGLIFIQFRFVSFDKEALLHFQEKAIS